MEYPLSEGGSSLYSPAEEVFSKRPCSASTVRARRSGSSRAAVGGVRDRCSYSVRVLVRQRVTHVWRRWSRLLRWKQGNQSWENRQHFGVVISPESCCSLKCAAHRPRPQTLRQRPCLCSEEIEHNFVTWLALTEGEGDRSGTCDRLEAPVSTACTDHRRQDLHTA